MSIADCAVAAIHGKFDVFDKVNGFIDSLILGIEKADPSEFLHFESGEEVSDDREEIIEKLEAAKESIDEVRLLCQQVLAATPD